MGYPPVIESSVPAARKQNVAFEQEELERARRRFTGFAGGAVFIGGLVRVALAEAAIARVASLATAAHSRVLVRSQEEFARQLNGDRLVTIERQEPHSRLPGLVVDVDPDVQLQEPGKAGNRRQEDRPDPLHQERDDT